MKKLRIPNWLKTVLKIAAGLFLFAAMFCYAMFQGGFVSWFLFYSITLIVLLVLLYTMIPLGTIHVTRTVGEGAVVAKSSVKVTVAIERKLPFPFLYLLIEDHIDESLKKQIAIGHEKMIFYPSFKRKLTYEYEIPSIRRGEYDLHGIQIKTSDMFGLIHKRKYVEQKDTILAYPNYYNIEKWSPYEKKDTETRLSTFDFIEELTSITGAREYIPGDKLTSIDWKVTARTSKLMTKEFEQFLGQNFLIVLNNRLLDDSNHSLESFEGAVELATSIIMHANKKQLNVGLWTVGDHTQVFPIDAGAEHQKRLIRFLAKIQGSVKERFSTPITKLETKHLSETTVVCISTEVTIEIIEQLRMFAAGRMKVFFCIIDKSGTKKVLNDKRIDEIRRNGVITYLLSEGNIDLAIPSHVG